MGLNTEDGVVISTFGCLFGLVPFFFRGGNIFVPHRGEGLYLMAIIPPNRFLTTSFVPVESLSFEIP